MDLRRRHQLGRRIQSLRDQQNIRQDALANQASIGRTTLQQIEGGKSSPRISTLTAIARVLKVPVSRLLSDEPLDAVGGGEGGGDRGGDGGGVTPDLAAGERHG